MKRLGLILSILLIFTLLPLGEAYAVPAYQGDLSYTQPDGTKVSYRLMGDESLHWKETTDGDVIVYDQSSKYYVYAQWKGNKIAKTEARVKGDKKPADTLTGDEVAALAASGALELSGEDTVSVMGISTQLTSSTIPAPTQNLLVIMIQFSDISCIGTEAFWNNRMFGASGSSVNDYYDEVSKGKLSFVPVSESWGTANDGVIKVTLPYAHPFPTGFGNDDEAVLNTMRATLTDALEAAVDYLPGLSAYDVNGDGFLSQDEIHLVTIFAGYEQSVGNTQKMIWAHAADYSGYGGVCELPGGLSFSGYVAVGERYNAASTMTIGVFCHELGHSLGLPDLYDYGGESEGLGIFSLMAGGSWGSATLSALPGSSPAHPDAWCKMQLGFAEVTTVETDGSYVLSPAYSTSGNILKIPDDSGTQYFLAEYRTFDGYDAALATGGTATEGIAVYHVDDGVFTYANASDILMGLCNENRFRKGVDLEEANEGLLGYSELDDWYRLGISTWDGRHLFTAASGWNLFGPATVPGSGLYSASIDTVLSEVPSSGVTTISGISLGVQSLGETAQVNVSVPAEAMSVDSIAKQYYTGTQVKPSLTVRFGTKVLTPEVDYQVTYSGNVFPGKALVHVTGLGDYADCSAEATFIIAPRVVSPIKLNLNETASMVSTRYRTVKASWDKVPGASGYLVAYKSASATTWSYTRTTATSWSRVLNAGTKYYVKVKPYVTVDGIRYYNNTYTTAKYVYTMKAPSCSLSDAGTHSVRITWTNIYGESGYQVRRATSYSGTYYLKKTLSYSYSSWVDTSTYRGHTYYYKVRAYKVVNGVRIYGPYSTIKKITR